MPESESVVEYRHFCECTSKNGVRIREREVGTCRAKGARDEVRTVTYGDWEPVSETQV